MPRAWKLIFLKNSSNFAASLQYTLFWGLLFASGIIRWIVHMMAVPQWHSCTPLLHFLWLYSRKEGVDTSRVNFVGSRKYITFIAVGNIGHWKFDVRLSGDVCHWRHFLTRLEIFWVQVALNANASITFIAVGNFGHWKFDVRLTGDLMISSFSLKASLTRLEIFLVQVALNANTLAFGNRDPNFQHG